MSSTVATDETVPARGRAVLWRVLALAALAALAVSFFTPSWSVSLEAPNYPAQTFPDGVKIFFHVDRVTNGCKMRDSKEVLEKEALDCVHEMDTINHFVGMFPIASGGPVEKMFSGFLFSMMGVMIVGWIVPGSRRRMLVVGVGFAAIAVWMSVALFTPNGVLHMGRGWVAGLVDSLGRSEDEGRDENLHPVVRQLKESLAKSGIQVDVGAPRADAAADTAQLVEVLKAVHDMKAPVELGVEPPRWSGRALDVMAWHYEESLGRWFNEPARNGRLVATMRIVAHIVYGGVLAAMLVFLWIARRSNSPLFLLYAAVPMLLPIGFVAEYAGWLWWYGHSLNAMGAFTLKPFMPTVFGDGKVAQFTTHSYPTVGFGLMMATAVLMAASALVRRSLPAAARD